MASSRLTLHVQVSERSRVVALFGEPEDETCRDQHHLELEYEDVKWAGAGGLSKLAQANVAFVASNGPSDTWGPGEVVGFQGDEHYRQLNEDGEFFVLVDADGSIQDEDHQELEKHFELRRKAFEVIKATA